MTKTKCPRCAGTGIYTGFGVCFRCNGAKLVNAPAPRKAQAAITETAEEKEARMRAALGDADYEALFVGGGYWE